MPTDMGGFAQAGGPAFVDRFGRPIALQINPITGAQRTDFATASGGETEIILGANPIKGSVVVFVNGALVNPTSMNGTAITLPPLTSGNVVGVMYRTFVPTARGISLISPSASALSIYNKLAAWWELSETSGTTFADSHTGGFDLSTYNSPTLNQTAIRGGGGASAQFVTNSGANRLVGTSCPIQTNTNSVFAWIKTPSAFQNGSGNGAPIMSTYYDTGTEGNQYLMFFLSATGTPYAQWSDGTTNYPVNAPSGNLATNSGYFIGYCRDGSAKTVTHYRNAVADTAMSYPTNLTGGVGINTTIELGNFHKYYSILAMLGNLQGVCVFSDALTSAEVAYLYNSGNGYSYAQIKANAGY